MIKTQSRLNRSDLLVEALSDEQLRWENNIQVYYIVLYYLRCLRHFNSNLTFKFYLDTFSALIDGDW